VVPGTSNFAANYTAAQLLAQVAQNDMVTKISDFIPAPSLAVFHSHFYQEAIGGDNGTRSNGSGGFYPDQGGDVGGAVYPIQADYDSILNTGAQILQRHQ
jgi:hypothetical protein